MFICITGRKGATHIVDYYISNARVYYTICEESVKLYGANTFAADNTFPGMCTRCESIYNEMYLDDLNFTPENTRTSLNSELMKQCILSEALIDTPQQKYHYCVSRGWRKLGRIKRMISGNRK